MKAIKNQSAAKADSTSGKQKATTLAVEGEAKWQPSAEQMRAVEEVTRLHGEIFHTSRVTAEKAIEIGTRLLALKADVGHGKWLLFIKENLPFSDKTAERYIGVANNRDKLQTQFDKMSNFTVTKAYRFLAGKEEVVSDPMPKSKVAGKDSTKAPIITEISRSVCDKLESLSIEALQRFRSDVKVFKRDWLKRNVEEAK